MRNATLFVAVSVMLAIVGGCSTKSGSGSTNPMGGAGTSAVAGSGVSAGASGGGAGASGGGANAGASAAAGSGTAAGANGGAAGSTPAADGGVAGSGGAATDAGGTQPPKLAMDECGLHTKWPGDEYCILPPPPDKGFQVHIGPSNYDNPEAQYVLKPNAETNMNFPATSGNTTDVQYYVRQYRMRPGSHHLIVNAMDGSSTGVGGFTGFGIGRRLGGTQNLARDNPDFGVIPPEDQDVGIPLKAKTPLSVNLHYINLSDHDELQEAWINFWYKDPAEVKETAKELYSMGGLGMAIQPHTHVTLGQYSCPISTAGRILSMYGHRHASTIRFSAWRVRGGNKQLIYEDYDWHDPLVLEFNSITTNMPPANGMGGGWSGPLDLAPGDTVNWECEVMNNTDGVLRFTNETLAGEMCILIGDTVGPSVMCNFQ